METKTAVFCDFDGTVSRCDIGYRLFRHFSGGENRELVSAWKSGDMSTRECLQREAALVKASADEIYHFLDQFYLNPGFREFADRCCSGGIPLTILSDGLDFYIDYVLRQHGLDRLPLIANRGSLEDHRLSVSFPHVNRTCRRCGSCKGERMREFRTRGGPWRLIFIGDGRSDLCALPEADMVFAKHDLEAYCRANNVAFTPFDDFFDVTRRLVEQCVLTEPAYGADR